MQLRYLYALYMKMHEFRIGLKFYPEAGKSQCTDVGSRVVVALKTDENDQTWLSGSPFAVPEVVFDEYDIEGCSLEPPALGYSSGR